MYYVQYSAWITWSLVTQLTGWRGRCSTLASPSQSPRSPTLQPSSSEPARYITPLRNSRNSLPPSHKVRKYKEYHSVRPLVVMGLSQPLSRQRVCPTPKNRGGGGGTLAGGEEVGGVPIPTTGKKKLSRVSTLPS